MNPESTSWNKTAESDSDPKMEVEVPKKAPRKAVDAPAASEGKVEYADYSKSTDDDKDLADLLSEADAGGVKGTDQTFPVKLHQLLSGSDEDGFSHIVSWQPHGRSFIVKKHKDFVDTVLPCCFRQTKFASFQRQLNLYGFRRITQGRDKGGYWHELFLRGRTLLALKMQRTKVKGTGARKPSSPETEPDFYIMPFCHEKSKAVAAAAPSPVAASRTESGAAARFIAQDLEAKISSPRRVVGGLGRADLASAYPTSSMLPGSLGGIRGAPYPSLLGPSDIPVDARRAMMARMIASSSSHFPGIPSSLPSGALGSSSFLYGALLKHHGPLHLNSNNRPCDCATPDF